MKAFSDRDIVVPESAAGERLDRFLARQWPDLSRARLQALIRDGRLLREGRPLERPSEPVVSGQHLALSVPPPAAAVVTAEALPLAIVFQDDAIVVVNKPAGMVVHPGAGVRHGTLVQALLHAVTELSPGNDLTRPGIVHRLDRFTSGLLVVAKTEEAHLNLSRQFQARTVEKLYTALVHGAPPDQERIELGIQRDRRRRIRMRAARVPAAEAEAVETPLGARLRPAETEFEVLERWSGSVEQARTRVREVWDYARLRVRIHTGRTHQIRVHLAALGFPVVGDSLYGAPRRPRGPEALQQQPLGRQFLHAGELAFAHPTSGARMRFEAPLPEELKGFLNVLSATCERHQVRGNGELP